MKRNNKKVLKELKALDEIFTYIGVLCPIGMANVISAMEHSSQDCMSDLKSCFQVLEDIFSASTGAISFSEIISLIDELLNSGIYLAIEDSDESPIASMRELLHQYYDGKIEHEAQRAD